MFFFGLSEKKKKQLKEELKINPLEPPKMSLEKVLKEVMGRTIDRKTVKRYQKGRIVRGTRELYQCIMRLSNEFMAPYSIRVSWEYLLLVEYNRRFPGSTSNELLMVKKEIEKQMKVGTLSFGVEYLTGIMVMKGIRRGRFNIPEPYYKRYSHPTEDSLSHRHGPFLMVQQKGGQPYYVGYWGENLLITPSRIREIEQVSSAVFPELILYQDQYDSGVRSPWWDRKFPLPLDEVENLPRINLGWFVLQQLIEPYSHTTLTRNR